MYPSCPRNYTPVFGLVDETLLHFPGPEGVERAWKTTPVCDQRCCEKEVNMEKTETAAQAGVGVMRQPRSQVAGEPYVRWEACRGKYHLFLCQSCFGNCHSPWKFVVAFSALVRVLTVYCLILWYMS